jgi:iron complex transport system ATP-binding protein
MDVIVLEDVSVVLAARTVVSRVSWNVARGSCAALLGPNGCGKSTLLRVISGYQYPTHGRVRVLGETFGATNLNDLRRGIRLVQPPNFYDLEPDLNVHQAVLTGFFGTLGLFAEATLKMHARANVVIAQLGLSHLRERPYQTLSTGERTRVLIARAMVEPAELLLLDEPTTGLDLPSREAVLSTIEGLAKQGGPTVVMTTHHVEELPGSTSNVLLMEAGQVAASGSPKEVLTGERLSRVYRTPVTVHCDNGRYYLHVYRGGV